MLDLSVYKWLHLAGVFAVLMAFGGLLVSNASGQASLFISKKMLSILHGAGLMITLVAGFGMLAKMGIHADLPFWAIAKFVIWLLLGALLAPVKRLPKLATVWWWSILGLSMLAAWLGIYKDL